MAAMASFIYAQTSDSLGSIAVGVGGGIAAITLVIGVLVRAFTADRTAYDLLRNAQEENAKLRVDLERYADMAQDLVETQRRCEQLRQERDDADDRIADLLLKIAELRGKQP